MAELITWAPRVGSTGDNRYKFGSGSTIPKIYRGAVGGSTPTTADVNALTGINQIIAEIKRRGGSADYVSGATQKSSKTFITALQTAINSIRTGEGASSYSFTTISDGTVKISNSILLQLRKALEVTETTVTSGGDLAWYESFRRDTPYGTLFTITNPRVPEDVWIGKTYAGGRMGRYRQIVQMPRATGFFSSYVLYLKLSLGSTIVFSETLESFGNLNVYCVDNSTDINNVANFAFSDSVSAGTSIPLDLDVDILNAMSTSDFFFLLATSNEIDTLGSSTPGTSGLGYIPFNTRDFEATADYTLRVSTH